MIRTESAELRAGLIDRRARIRRLHRSLMILWLVGLVVLYMLTVGRSVPSSWPVALRSSAAANAQTLFARSAVGVTGLVATAALVGRVALRSARPRREPRRQFPAALHWLFALAFGIGAVLFLSAGLQAVTDPGVSNRGQANDVSLALICGAGAIGSAISAIRRGKE